MDNSKIRLKHDLKEKTTINIGFNLEDFTMKDFRVFLILLLHSGEDLSVLSKAINAEFNLRSRTKGYSYINKICRAGYAYKRKINVDGKRTTKVYVNLKTRAAYNSLFAPTIETTRKVIEEVVKDYLKEFSNINQVSQKLLTLSENNIETVKQLISKTSPKKLTNDKFFEEISSEIRATCRSELFKLEMYSKRLHTKN